MANTGDFSSFQEHAWDLLRIALGILGLLVLGFCSFVWWLIRGIYSRLNTVEKQCRETHKDQTKLDREQAGEIGELRGYMRGKGGKE
jgi:hypothetical protein